MTTTEKDIREMTVDTIGRDILQALIQEIRLLPKPWVSMTKAKQDGDGMDDHQVDEDGVVDVEATDIEHQPLEEELQDSWDAGYEAAKDGKSQADCPVMPGRLCIEWIKGWKYWHEEENGDDIVDADFQANANPNDDPEEETSDDEETENME